MYRNKTYTGDNLNHIAFPIGGIGAGMFTLQGAGNIGNISFRNRPDLNNEPNIFAAVYSKQANTARVLEGQVPAHKIFSATGGNAANHGMGWHGKNYGLPRYKGCEFSAKFPFAQINLTDKKMPLYVSIEGFSPFIPGDSYSASLPFGVLQYTFTNTTDKQQDGVFYFNSFNFTYIDYDKHWIKNDKSETCPIENGFSFSHPGSKRKPWEELSVSMFTDDFSANVDTAWFRGGWFDTLTMLWNNIAKGISETKSHDDPISCVGGTISVPFSLKPKESKTIRVFLSWYAPASGVTHLNNEPKTCTADNEYNPGHIPWYVSQFKDISELNQYIKENYSRLYDYSRTFSDCLFASTLPPVIMEAVSANLSILKSTTMLRQTDGRLWCWEGSQDAEGSCAGSCTHVWNYAQALSHLFPDLERTFRQTEFNDSQNDDGHQNFRASLPIGETTHDFHAAADGQLGGIMKMYREWRIFGDIDWLRSMWSKVKQSLEYCIKTWDPALCGWLVETRHNTYDIEFCGPDSMCSSYYLGALLAAEKMADALDDPVGETYAELYQKGRTLFETQLYNGEYFIQGPNDALKYQYVNGCLSEGIAGAWLAWCCGLGDILDKEKMLSHLLSVYKYNFKENLIDHANPQRPGYALGNEGGLLLCSWPHGGKPKLPFVYSDEVWTGIEYEVASFLIAMGYVEEGENIVKACRKRYDGKVRNPFNEYECGHWYARALASYALLKAYSGAEYDAVTKTLTLSPAIQGDFKCFISTATGFGLTGTHDDKPFLDVKHGYIEVETLSIKPVLNPTH